MGDGRFGGRRETGDGRREMGDGRWEMVGDSEVGWEAGAFENLQMWWPR